MPIHFSHGEIHSGRGSLRSASATEPPTKESGIEARLQLNGDFRDGYWAGVEATKTERDALRKALDKIAQGNWNVGAEHDVTAREFARRALERSS